MTYQQEVIVAGITLFLNETRKEKKEDVLAKTLMYCEKHRNDKVRMTNVASALQEVLELEKLNGNDQLGEILKMYLSHKRFIDIVFYISFCLTFAGIKIICNKTTGKIELAETDQEEASA